MMNNSGYSTTGAVGSAAAPSGGPVPAKGEYWSLERCKKAYLDYLGNKTEEIEEQKDARRYYHGAQWTEKQIKALNDRKQPVVTFNRIGRKIDGVVGLIERLRQDPKAFPRTPQHEEGAELATAAIRFVLDEQEWKAKSPEVARDAAIDGLAGIAIELTPSETGDHDVAFEAVETDSFFYNPRSYRPDFSDSNYMGEGKWVDVEIAQDLFPDHADDLAGSGEDGSDLSTNPDRENKWFSFDGTKKLVRLVDIWYQHKGKWCWAIFTGSMILSEGGSYLYDEKNKTICRYIMFSCNVDHDGDRYGFVRNMKSAQDEYNHRRSKSLHNLGTKRIFVVQGAVSDVETTRRELVREDGVVEIASNDLAAGLKVDDKSMDFAGQLKLMENAIAELENYGPNQALVGDMQNQSGRAIQLLQQAGMAELGPYIMGYRGWKIRVYRALFNAVQRYWTAERWIRVTDDEGLAQFVKINGVGTDPRTGMPTVVNALGTLDVDIIMDEGADTINAQQDVYETMSNVLPTIGPMLTPPEARAAVGILVNSSALDATAKKAWRDAAKAAQQPDPMQQQAQQVALAGEAAKVRETDSKTMLNMAKAGEAGQPEMGAAPGPAELPMEVQVASELADIENTQADTLNKRAQAFKTQQEGEIAPIKAAYERQMGLANLAQSAHDKAEDREIAARAARNRTAQR